jgi:predicted secreted protein
MAINGNNVLIYRNGTAIAGTISNEIQTGAELIEISSPTSGQWKKYITGRKSWSVNVSYLILANNGVRDLLNVGTSYTLKIRGRNATDATGVVGTGILKSCKITATRGNIVQGSFTFQGTSSLT